VIARRPRHSSLVTLPFPGQRAPTSSSFATPEKTLEARGGLHPTHGVLEGKDIAQEILLYWFTSPDISFWRYWINNLPGWARNRRRSNSACTGTNDSNAPAGPPPSTATFSTGPTGDVLQSPGPGFFYCFFSPKLWAARIDLGKWMEGGIHISSAARTTTSWGVGRDAIPRRASVPGRRNSCSGGTEAGHVAEHPCGPAAAGEHGLLHQRKIATCRPDMGSETAKPNDGQLGGALDNRWVNRKVRVNVKAAPRVLAARGFPPAECPHRGSAMCTV